MADTSRLCTLTQVVQRAEIANGGDESKHLKYLQLAIEAYRELRLHTIQEGRTQIKVTPNALNRVTFPEDMISFIGIGVPVNGKIYLLTENNDIIRTYTTAESGAMSLDASDGEGVDLPTSQATTIRATGGINPQGYYTIDWDNDCIIINATQRSELLLEYTSSGVDTSDITYVPVVVVPAMVAYILWQDKETDMNVPENIVIRFEKRWVREERKLHKLNFSVDAFKDVLTSTYGLLNK